MKPGIVADEMFPEGTSAIMEMDDEVNKLSTNLNVNIIVALNWNLLFVDWK